MCVIKSTQVYIIQNVQFEKTVCVLRLVMAWEALLRRFSQIMLSGPYQTQLSVLITSFSPLSLSHTNTLSLTHTFFLSLQVY